MWYPVAYLWKRARRRFGDRPRLSMVIVLVIGALAVVGCGTTDTGTTSAAVPDSLAEGWSTDFARRSVDLSEISSGGPPKDGIPPVDDPRFARPDAIDTIGDREPTLVVELGDRVRVYPIQILIWHEIVNDTIESTPIAVTYCPLCNTALVFDRRVDGRTLDFGTTGNLRNSDLVMYDRQTESWWQQFGGEGIVGEYTGTTLTRVPSRIMSFGDVRDLHPDADVLTRETGVSRPYGENPYEGYDQAGSSTYFGTENADDRRLDPKERVVFVEVGDRSVAIPFAALQQRRQITFTIASTRMTAHWRGGVASALDASAIASGREVGAAEVVDERGRLVPFEEPFWFAIAAFRPNVQIIRE